MKEKCDIRIWLGATGVLEHSSQLMNTNQFKLAGFDVIAQVDVETAIGDVHLEASI